MNLRIYEFTISQLHLLQDLLRSEGAEELNTKFEKKES